MPASLQNKAAIVTGGGSGLGRATAEALAAKGAKVTVFDLNSAAAEEVSSAKARNSRGIVNGIVMA